ncbi:MAG: SOS response-associated peptidase [Leptolyngbyaceae cyanobacterium]
MCGRFAQTQTGETVAAAFQLSVTPELTPRYNIAPSQSVAVITQARRTGDRQCHDKRWGLISKWSKDTKIGYKLINARAETVATKPSFRGAFQQRRCLIVADGFYEWQKDPQTQHKQPHLIRLKSRSLFAFAGLWERWQDPQTHETTFSCTILTTTANAALAPIHHRMPVILSSRDYDAWLDSSFYNPGMLEALLCPFTAAAMETLPITSAVNNPRNETVAVQQPA